MAKDFIRTWDGRRLEDWGCSVSKEFKQFQGAMKCEVKRLAEAQGATLTSWSNGHYDMTGVLERNGLYVYFHYSNIDRTKVALTHKYDVWLGSTLMRTMKHAKDWTGGTNHHIEFERFTETMEYLFKQQQPAAVPQEQATKPETSTPKTETKTMASKIQSYYLYVPIKPYKLDGINDEFNEVSVTVSYDDRHHQFDVTMHAGYGNGRWHGYTLYDGRGWLTDTQWVTVKDAPRNSQKTINQMGANLELAKDDIAWLFNERKFEELKQLVKDVALYGYTAMIEERMKSIKNEAMVTVQVEAGRKAEAQVVVKQVDVMGLMGALSTKGEAKLSDYATPVEVNDNQDEPIQNSQITIQNSETTMEANNMKAADLIGKTIIVGENIATITIKSSDGDKLQGEFKKAGGTMGMQLPITLENLRQQIAAGAWRLDEPAVEPTDTAATEPDEEVEFTEYEDVTDEPSGEPEGDARGEAAEDDPFVKLYRFCKVAKPEHIVLFKLDGIFCAIMDDAPIVGEACCTRLSEKNGYTFVLFKAEELSTVMPKLLRQGKQVSVVDAPKDETLPAKPEPKRPMTATERIVVARVPRPGEKADEPKPKARVQPKAVKVEEEPEAAPHNNVIALSRDNEVEAPTEDVTPTADDTATLPDWLVIGAKVMTKGRYMLNSKGRREWVDGEEMTVTEISDKWVRLNRREDGTIVSSQSIAIDKAAENMTPVEEAAAEDVVVQPSGEPEGNARERVAPKRPSECTLDAKKCAPYIIDQGGACIYVGGNTEKLEGILYLMWGRKRAYQEGENKYSGVQVSRKHKKMLEAILKIA